MTRMGVSLPRFLCRPGPMRQSREGMPSRRRRRGMSQRRRPVAIRDLTGSRDRLYAFPVPLAQHLLPHYPKPKALSLSLTGRRRDIQPRGWMIHRHATFTTDTNTIINT